jgi:hypothetical protein
LENRVSGPRRDKVIEKWKRLHNDELHNQHSLANIILVSKSRLGRYAGHVAVKE